MELKVTRHALTTMQAAAAAARPNEACGILLGEGGRIVAAVETANVDPDPATHFEIDPQALIDAHRAARAGGPDVIGYFHSHPVGAPVPSATDRASAAHDGRVWAIIAGERVQFWRDAQTDFVALSFTIIES